MLTNGNANPQLDADLSKKAALLEITSISGVFNFAINFVVCENVRDYDLYKWGTDSLVKALKDNIFNLNIMPYNGGGSTIVDSVRHLNGFNKLLITDSDKNMLHVPKEVQILLYSNISGRKDLIFAGLILLLFMRLKICFPLK